MDIILVIAIVPPGIDFVFSITDDIAGSFVVIPEISQEMLEYVATEIEFFFGENK